MQPIALCKGGNHSCACTQTIRQERHCRTGHKTRQQAQGGLLSLRVERMRTSDQSGQLGYVIAQLLQGDGKVTDLRNKQRWFETCM